MKKFPQGAIDIPHEFDISEAAWVWLEELPPGRNQFAIFRHEVSVGAGGVARGWLQICCDTRYVLRINGEWVMAGPPRFATGHPEFDTIGIGRYLRPGNNIIEVAVNFFGSSSYQSMPDGAPGFRAGGVVIDGRGRVICGLGTPGAWRGWESVEWHKWTANFSFAQNPLEIRDTRLADACQPRGLRVLDGESAPWGRIHPYEGPPPTLDGHFPDRLDVAAGLRTDELRAGLVTFDPLWNQGGRGGKTSQRCLATWIHSPREQEVRLSGFWGDYWLNGAALPKPRSKEEDSRGNHWSMPLQLRQGPNLLWVRFELLAECWTFLLGLPRDSGCAFSAEKERIAGHLFRVSPIFEKGDLAGDGSGEETIPADWMPHDGSINALTPSRMMAWDEIANDARVSSEPQFPYHVVLEPDGAFTWVFHFSGEYLGYPSIEIEAPEGAVLDVGYDDWQRADGRLAFYDSNPFTESADRYILKGGIQKITAFHIRGGKVIQITMRLPLSGREPSAVTLHGLRVISRKTLKSDETSLVTDYPALNFFWKASMRTLIDSTDEAYSDCPWRERGTYIGDALVNMHLQQLLDADLRVARRCLRIFAQAQLPNGQLRPCAPSWLDRPLVDFSLHFIRMVRDYRAFTGDVELVGEVWPAIQRIWSSSAWVENEFGLWDVVDPNAQIFIDWGKSKSDWELRGNAALNVLRVAAARHSAELARLLGLEPEAEGFDLLAERVEKSVLRHLYRPASGTLQPNLADAVGAGLHANVLFLHYGLGTPEIRQRMVEVLEPDLRDNLRRGLTKIEGRGHLELFFHFFALPALAENGRPDIAEAMLRDVCGYLRDFGADTLPECFSRVHQRHGSLCHAWAAAPAIYAARYIAGIRQVTPGDPDHLVVAPVAHGFQNISLKIAHPRGFIHVAWQRPGNEFTFDISAPDGVRIKTPATFEYVTN